MADKYFTQKEIRSIKKEKFTGNTECLRRLLEFEERAGWNGGNDGWNCDIYLLDDVMYLVGINTLGLGKSFDIEILRMAVFLAEKIKTNEKYSEDEKRKRIKEWRMSLLDATRGMTERRTAWNG